MNFTNLIPALPLVIGCLILAAGFLTAVLTAEEGEE